MRSSYIGIKVIPSHSMCRWTPTFGALIVILVRSAGVWNTMARCEPTTAPVAGINIFSGGTGESSTGISTAARELGGLANAGCAMTNGTANAATSESRRRDQLVVDATRGLLVVDRSVHMIIR